MWFPLCKPIPTAPSHPPVLHEFGNQDQMLYPLPRDGGQNYKPVAPGSSWLLMLKIGVGICSILMVKNSPPSRGTVSSLVMYDIGISCSELSIIVLAKQHPKCCLQGHYIFWSRCNIFYLLTLPFQPFCLILGINFGHLLQLVITFHRNYGNWVYLKSAYLPPIWLHFFGFMVICWRHIMAKAFQ